MSYDITSLDNILLADAPCISKWKSSADYLQYQGVIFILLLGGDLSGSPASLEAHLPRAPPHCDQANVLFAPVSFCLLDSRHLYSAVITISAVLASFLAGLMLLILRSTFVNIGEKLNSSLWYVRVKCQDHWMNRLRVSGLNLRLVTSYVPIIILFNIQYSNI